MGGSHFGTPQLENSDLDVGVGRSVGGGLVHEQRDRGCGVNQGCGF